MKRYAILSIAILSTVILLLMTGCSTFNTTIQDPAGRAIPTPHYVLQAVGLPLTVTFYYVALKEIKDVDGSVIIEPEYLDLLIFHDIQFKKYKGILLVIEVNNPSELKYILHETKTITTGKNLIEVQVGGILNSSDLKYRQFVYALPYDPHIHNVDYLVTVNVYERDIMRIGNFRYKLLH